MEQKTVAIAFSLMLTGVLAADSGPDPVKMASELRVATPTIHSIGFEWDLDGDSNHNAVCKVRFRKVGAGWKEALPLLRIDYRGWYTDMLKPEAYRHFNMLAGSIMFLEPGTAYEIELAASDPDGGNATKTLAITTRAVPKLAAPQRTLHVVPRPSTSLPPSPGLRGAGGTSGEGTKDNPFKGFAAAAAAAQPGDTFLLHAGEYEGGEIFKSGEPGKYIAFKAAGDGEAIFRSSIVFKEGKLGHLWFEGLVFDLKGNEPEPGRKVETQKIQKPMTALFFAGHANRDIVILRNLFRRCTCAIANADVTWNGSPDTLNRNWHIADNTNPGSEISQYFARLYMLADSDICYNRMATTYNFEGGDGVSVRFSANVDIYGNDIREIDDDCIEPDWSYANIRIWRNRMVSPRWQMVSMQPMLCSPWYVVRNEVVLAYTPKKTATPFKANVFDRFVLANNTFYIRGMVGQGHADVLLRTISRNNLWVFVHDNPDKYKDNEGHLWEAEGSDNLSRQSFIRGQTFPDWKSDVDYDGLDWGDVKRPFLWRWPKKEARRIETLEEFVRQVGIEKHAVRVKKEEIFEIQDIPAYALEAYSPKRLALKADCNAIDAGAPLPNICDEFLGKAPDLGAYEFGAPLPLYGPRP